MSEGKNTKLIADAREASAEFLDYEPGEYEVIIENGWKLGAARLTRLADALEAADARNAAEYQRGHDRAEHRYRSAIANYKLVAETFGAERDAALAEVETQRRNALENFGAAAGALAVIERAKAEPLWEDMERVLLAAPTEALAEHDRVIAEKAWDACQKANDRFNSRAVAAQKIGRPDLAGPLSLNPYRANPEPNGSTNG